MALNPYHGRNIEWLEARIADLQDARTAVSVQSVSSGDVSITYRQQITTIDSELEKLFAAARLVDPDRYPVASTTRDDHVVATFRQNYSA